MNKNEPDNFDTGFKHLNEMQRQAVLAADGAMLLLAGAGSGKTTVLISRIASLLINKGVEPYAIIAITFTNKAAREMKERLLGMGIPGAGQVWASTFHSACARMLRRDIDRLGYERSFAIYDTADSASLMKRILKEQEVDEKDIGHKTVLGYISRAKDAMITAQEFISSAEKQGDPRRRVIGYAYAEYEKRMKASNSLDFDDLILLTVKLLGSCPDVLRHYQNRFKYVLVDEYQDTNYLQYRLTAALAGGYGNICVVGDDDQSIYKFRGATIENILSFEKHFPDARIIRLEQNYRSTGSILNAANDVIRNNKGRKGKVLWTENPRGEKPVLYIVSDEREEAQTVADEIKKSVSSGRRWQEHVILYRMNAQSNQFETAFNRNGIPYRVYGGTGFYERAEVKDMLAYLCVIHNPDDDIRLLRIINNPARGLGDTTVARLQAAAEELGTSVYKAISRAHEYENLRGAAAKLKAFADMIEDLREMNGRDPAGLDSLYDELIKKTGYIRRLEENKTDENLSRIENVQELKTNIIAFMNEGGESLFDFLSETALYTDMDRDGQGAEKDCVLMMTMHSAKGLEFDTVFIAGAEEGIFPGLRVLGDPEEIEEERRLCYVAMTRAMQRLCFISARQRMIFGRTSAYMPSRFIHEINPGNIETKNLYNTNTRFSSSFGTGNLYMPGMPGFFSKTASGSAGTNYTQAEAFGIGDNVEHKAFGRGVVTGRAPAGNDALLTVDFGPGGAKRLLEKSASQFMKKC